MQWMHCNLTAEVIDVDSNPVNTIHAGDDDIPVKIYWHVAADRFTMSTPCPMPTQQPILGKFLAQITRSCR